MTADTAATTMFLETVTAPLDVITGVWEAAAQPRAAAARSVSPFASQLEPSTFMDAYVAALAAFGATCFAIAGFLQAASML